MTSVKWGVEVRPSTIPGAGNGLFAARDFSEGQLVCEYTGEILTFLQAMKAADKTYLMGGFGLNVHVDARHCPDSMGRYINDPRNSSLENVKFDKRKDLKKALVIATRSISVCSCFRESLLKFRLARKYSHLMVNLTGESIQERSCTTRKKFPAFQFLIPEMTLVAHQTRLLDEIRSAPTERHSQLLPDGSTISAVEVLPGLDSSHVQTVQRLGLGTHAEVYEARLLATASGTYSPMTIAVKVEKPIRQSTGFLLKEIEILRAMANTGATPKYLGVYTVQIAEVDCLCVGMELFEESLSSLKTRKDLLGDVRAELLDWLALKMFECIFTVHKSGYVHRDLKPSNFMYRLSHDGQAVNVVVIDFGSAVAIGEKNDVAFRGTGSYASISADPFDSQPIDDMWSVGWALLELSLDNGLPWRSISARSEEGREELLKQKISMLDALVDGAVEGVPALTRSVLRMLYDIHKGCASVEHLKTLISSSASRSCMDSLRVVEIMRPPSYRRLHNRKIPPVELLLNSHHRKDLVESVSHGTPFSSHMVPPFIASAVAAIHAADSPGHLMVGSVRICVTDLLSSGCTLPDCPLLHLPQRGIERSVIAREMRKSPVCVDALVRKCRLNGCTLRHLDGEEMKNLFAVKRRRLD